MAADDMKTKKRKGASDAAPKPKKQKKVDETAPVAPSAKSARKRAADPIDDEEAPAKTDVVLEKKSKKTKKSKTATTDDAVGTAAVVVEVKEKPKKKAKKNEEPDVAAVVEVVAEAPNAKTKKEKRSKRSDDALVPAVESEAVVPEQVTVAVEVKKPKKAKKSKKQEEAPVEEVAEPVEETAAEDEEDLDDQTAALLAGFESDRDESDLEKEDEIIDEDAVPKLSKKQRKALENVRKGSEPGVVYLGRIPHGFFEPQMKKYFSQFGDIKRLRLSRNKKTGASKHYAFIEFRHGEVADIAAQAMNNYLMFGHILQCRVIPSEKVHEELFKGSNERFKVDPRNKKAGNEMERGASRADWETRVQNENKRRTRNAKALQDEFGYSFTAPTVKTVDAVPKKALAAEDEAEQQLLDEAPAAETTTVVQVTESTPDQLTITETVKVKKTKKKAKSEVKPEPEATAVAEPEAAPTPKAKKEKKRKSDVGAEQVEEAVSTPKNKKAKKDTATEGEVQSDKKRKTKVADQDGVKPKKAKRHSMG